VTDPAANKDKNKIETITVTVTTRNKDSSYDNRATTVTLTETGVNTGVFRSQSLFLVSDTVDQKEKVAPGRNFLVALGGQVLVTYKGNKEVQAEAKVPVLYTVNLRFIVLKDKAGGKPIIPSTAFAKERFQIAQERWAQAGIQVQDAGLENQLKNPVDPPLDLSKGLNLARIDNPPKLKVQPLSKGQEALLGYKRVNDGKKYVYVYFVNYQTEPYTYNNGPLKYSYDSGTAYAQANTPAKYANAIILSSQSNPNAPIDNRIGYGEYVLAHELGHVLFNRTLDQAYLRDHTETVTDLMYIGSGSAIGKDEMAVTDPKRLSKDEASRAQTSDVLQQPGG
jgi:hypothetical protein